MRKTWKVFLSLILACLTLTMAAIPALAADTPGKIDYVAFGDSVAAGVRGGAGAPGSEPSSDKGYTDCIANLLLEAGVLGSFDESFCTSGMTAKLLAQNCAVLLDQSSDGARLIQDAEIVTLDIGANDLLGPLYGYVTSLKSAADIDPLQAKTILTGIAQDLYGTTGTGIQSDITTILNDILTANGSVKIYVMGYYNPLPTLSALYGVDLNEPVKYMNTLIQKSISDAIAENPDASIIYVDTFTAMAASADALVPTDIHPTEAGYRIIAGEFWKLLEETVSFYIADAAPSTSKIVVNGVTIPFKAYDINGNIYLKLRDVAMALNGTAKQIAVSYDNTAKSVGITTDMAYAPIGGELSGNGAETAATACLSMCEFLLNGTKVDLTAYIINGHNYILLGDLARIFNFSVDCFEDLNTVNIDVTKAYTPED